MSEGKQLANEPVVLAWYVLRAVNRTQAKGSSVRLVVPSAPEVAYEVGMELTEAQLLRVEEYLHYNGYIESANIDLTPGVYTITPTGFGWLEEGMPKLSPSKDRVRELAERPGEEAAFESVLRAELEVERRRMEEIEHELLDEEGRQQEQPPGEPSEAAAKQDRGDEPRSSSTKGTQEGAEPRSWWRRMFGG